MDVGGEGDGEGMEVELQGFDPGMITTGGEGVVGGVEIVMRSVSVLEHKVEMVGGCSPG
jgi:hypothetical protein